MKAKNIETEIEIARAVVWAMENHIQELPFLYTMLAELKWEQMCAEAKLEGK